MAHTLSCPKAGPVEKRAWSWAKESSFVLNALSVCLPCLQALSLEDSRPGAFSPAASGTHCEARRNSVLGSSPSRC